MGWLTYMELSGDSSSSANYNGTFLPRGTRPGNFRQRGSLGRLRPTSGETGEQTLDRRR